MSALKRTTGVSEVADAVAPLLRFLEGLKPGTALIAKQEEEDARAGMLTQLLKDLRFAAQVLDQLDSSVYAAWTLFEDLVQAARSQSGGRLKLRAHRRRDRCRPGTASHEIESAVGHVTKPLPPHLLPDATGLWQAGLSVRSANELARAGFRTLVELLAFRPFSKLRSIRGLGPSVVEEVTRLMDAKGWADEGPAVEVQVVQAASGPRTWAEMCQQVVKAMEGLGGTATLTQLVSLGMTYSRTKKAIALLEGSGRVYRTGIRKATRYYLSEPGGL